MADSVEIQGEIDPRFARIKDAFAANFATKGEVGAAVAITLDNRPVVDIWGGHTDRGRTKPWTRDTIVNVWSTTKGPAAMCSHRLAEQGRLDLDAPVLRYWPQFAQAGKDKIPVSYLLNHKAGLPAIKAKIPAEMLYDWEAMTAALAAHQPWWEPGTRHGYHAFTFGYLSGEVVRRITGKSLGTYFRDEFAVPLGLDFHIGLDARHDERVAQMIGADPVPPGETNLFTEAFKDPESVSTKALANPTSLMQVKTINTREWRGAEIPAANGHGNARGLARLYGALACGGSVDAIQVLSAESIARCHTEQSRGQDAVLLRETRFGPGFMLPQPGMAHARNPRTFGHPGAGGSIAFADPDTRIGFAYVMNKMRNDNMLDTRAAALIEAMYESLS
jgi:CubicO group peptidase (beta-lactamase class C family)